MEAKNLHKQQYQVLDEEIWRKKYESLLGEVVEKEGENKRLKQKINEVFEEMNKKEEHRNMMMENYENKLKNINFEVLELKNDSIWSCFF